MKHLAKSLETFKNYLATTPQEEVAALIAQIDATGIGGPSVEEYLEQLDHSLKLESWLESWPIGKPRPNGNWGFEAPTKMDFQSPAVVHSCTTRIESDDEFVETSICEAA